MIIHPKTFEGFAYLHDDFTEYMTRFSREDIYNVCNAVDLCSNAVRNKTFKICGMFLGTSSELWMLLYRNKNHVNMGI